MDITKEDYEPIKKLYIDSLSDGKLTFIYKGHEILTSYAKYLLTYLENKK